MRRGHLFLLPFLLTGATLLLMAGSKPPAATKGPVPKGSCAVCGMYVANFPDWAAVVTFKDGGQAWFDGPKDMFTFLFDLKQFAAKRNTADIASVQVKDYYALKYIDGQKAYFVMGSDVMGPMGKELIPFATEADARDFLKDHKGRKVIAYKEITSATLKGLE